MQASSAALCCTTVLPSPRWAPLHGSLPGANNCGRNSMTSKARTLPLEAWTYDMLPHPEPIGGEKPFATVS